MTIADMSRLRVDVYVEQKDVPFVHVGDMADVADGANPDRKVQGAHRPHLRRARSAHPHVVRGTRCRQQRGLSGAGVFAYVTLHVPVHNLSGDSGGRPLVRGASTFIANIAGDNPVHLQPVKVATTDGTDVSLAEGARVGDRVALNLPDEVGDGSGVRPIEGKRWTCGRTGKSG